MPVLHRLECGLRGRLAGKRGPCPLLSITPAMGRSRVPATANKFVHILWKNLICDNVAADKFRACPRGGGLAMYGLCLLFA